MNIVYTVDDKFVPQLATGIYSVCKNNETEDITFYVISKGISESNKKNLVDWVASLKQKIDIIELDDISNYIDFEFDTSSWNDIVLARLFFDKLLPDSVDKILYLDGDTMVRGSLVELWNTDMKEYVLAAAIEPTANKVRKEAIHLNINEPYYNAGVLLINMRNWKEVYAGKKYLIFIKT